MSNQQTDRVFSRTNARLLNPEELQSVNGGIRTGVCTIDPKTCAMDNDCPVPIGC